MSFKDLFEQVNIFSQCKRQGFSLWQCPQFLFVMMGVIIIISTITAYFLGSQYISDPLMVALTTMLLAVILLIFAFTITNNFEKLAEANRLKTEFVNIVSHQLRTPLSNLVWAIELLMSGRAGKIDEKQLEYFKILRENTGRMKELVNNLLTVSRIEQGTLSSKKEEIFLEDLINDTIKHLTPFIKASNVEISFEVQKNLPKIYIDPNQIKLAIENLLDNAVRYTKDKGKIEIRTESRGKDVYFEIKDNGVGIPKDDQKFIFQKFFRSSNAVKHQTQGSGLGLYIVKSIIKKAGGKIGLVSIEGKGTTFWFTLPIFIK